MIPLPAMNPILIALVISVAANAALGWAYLGQRDETATARADLRGMEGMSTAATKNSAMAISNVSMMAPETKKPRHAGLVEGICRWRVVFTLR